MFEEAGYSLLGPLALNCAAPDEGNMHLLEQVADRRAARALPGPLAAGEVRSCFAMTEPAPGAGSDPSMLRDHGDAVDGGWRINGRKWFITGAEGAAFAICMARTGSRSTAARRHDVPRRRRQPRRRGRARASTRSTAASPAATARSPSTTAASADDAVLGEVGEGFAYAQVRLAPARLTHCMRWLGSRAARTTSRSTAPSSARPSASRSASWGWCSSCIADNEIDLETQPAADLARARGRSTRASRAPHESSIAKAFVAEAVGRVVDRSRPDLRRARRLRRRCRSARFLREVRPFRIYDGPSETHRWAIARRALRDRARERAGR